MPGADCVIRNGADRTRRRRARTRADGPWRRTLHLGRDSVHATGPAVVVVGDAEPHAAVTYATAHAEQPPVRAAAGRDQAEMPLSGVDPVGVAPQVPESRQAIGDRECDRCFALVLADGDPQEAPTDRSPCLARDLPPLRAAPPPTSGRRATQAPASGRGPPSTGRCAGRTGARSRPAPGRGRLTDARGPPSGPAPSAPRRTRESVRDLDPLPVGAAGLRLDEPAPRWQSSRRPFGFESPLPLEDASTARFSSPTELGAVGSRPWKSQARSNSWARRTRSPRVAALAALA